VWVKETDLFLVAPLCIQIQLCDGDELFVSDDLEDLDGQMVFMISKKNLSPFLRVPDWTNILLNSVFNEAVNDRL
jgi:hypothetical protein